MIEQAMELLLKYGWAVFFAFISLVLGAFLVRLLVKDKEGLVRALERERDRTAKMARIVERNANANDELAKATNKLRYMVDKKIQQDAEIMGYIQGRDRSRGT